MSEPYQIVVPGLQQIENLQNLPEKTQQSARRAVNRTIDRARTLAARIVGAEVAFPAGYLAPSQGRLTVSKKASGDDLEAIVTGQHRPTSLARFTSGSVDRRNNGVRVTVQPGLARYLPRAFFVKLNTGAGRTETRFNLGLAIRLPEGRAPSAAYRPTQIGEGLWLLYGPSIDQVFDDAAEKIAPEMADFLAAEFNRQMGLD